MSVCVEVHAKNDPDDPYWNNCTLVYEQKEVIGRVLALVVKHEDGSITLERDIAVSADNADDNELAEATVKAVEAKLNKAFPDPNQPQPSKLWVPGK